MSDAPPTSDGAAPDSREHDLVELLAADITRAEAVALELQSRGVTALVFPGGGGWTITGHSDQMVVMVPRAQIDAARDYLAHEHDPRPIVRKAHNAWKRPLECPRCRYSLDGLEEIETCPECGSSVFAVANDEPVVELINTDALRAHAIAADLESAGIEVRVHELRGIQAQTAGWRVFVFARDVDRARRVLAEAQTNPPELIGECPACGHTLAEPAPRCPDCGLSLAPPGRASPDKGADEQPEGPEDARGAEQAKKTPEPMSWVGLYLAAVFVLIFVVAIVRQVLT